MFQYQHGPINTRENSQKKTKIGHLNAVFTLLGCSKKSSASISAFSPRDRRLCNSLIISKKRISIVFIH